MGLWDNHYMGLREYHLFPSGIITIIVTSVTPYFPQFGHFWRILQSLYGIMGGYTSIV
jgi:hypothetical protein